MDRPYPDWGKYIRPLVQQWYDENVHRGNVWGPGRQVTALIGEQEPMDITTFDSGRRVTSMGPPRWYAVDENDIKHEISADEMNRILDLARLKEAADHITTVACMWCGAEVEAALIDAHEATCS